VGVAKRRTERAYSLLGLQLKRVSRKNYGPVACVSFVTATQPNEIWSFDFISGYALVERRLKVLTIVVNCLKHCPGLLAEYSITSRMLIQFFNGLSRLPKKLRCDNGPEMTSREFMGWEDQRGIQVEFIAPGKPIQNVYAESFNSRFRDECLNQETFIGLEDAKKKIEKRKRSYNSQTPHSVLGMKTPIEFVQGLKKKT
jgi:putative transposase